MLILSRKSQETVVVGGSANFEHILKVTVLVCLGNNRFIGANIPGHSKNDLQIH